jgi:Asp-tRNA(Asn)/Glu-tRNA(Gln) amidotransferase A subunit family amidase
MGATMSATASRTRYEAALAADKPLERLREAVVHDLEVVGRDRAAVYRALDELRLDLRRAGREADEDNVMDVMDFLVGWCSPHRRL